MARFNLNYKLEQFESASEEYHIDLIDTIINPYEDVVDSTTTSNSSEISNVIFQSSEFCSTEEFQGDQYQANNSFSVQFTKQRRERRGFYATKACINCKQKHAKCSGGETCERCRLYNLECSFIDSGKKRGPRTNGKHSKPVYVLNGPENDFNGTSMLSSIISINDVQDQASTQSSLSEYLPQEPNYIDELTLFSASQNIHASPVSPSFFDPICNGVNTTFLHSDAQQDINLNLQESNFYDLFLNGYGF
ncbi:hypothetical protein F8M41_021564 [Gigaspora margarita]|uniref:Zn(2)-C6 fungal-type domain-containing protein n=1 Tax=Gigaspora margarita TaxID=4874 RepID=A0A8H4EIR4_GIGMA|nr:hypothetical protein F8M41_021564 [Gigaspora margarita]